MIDIFAKWIDGKIVCVPKKRRGMSKGEYIRAASAALELNAASYPTLSCRELSLLSGIDLDLALSLLCSPSGEKNTPEHEPIAPDSLRDDDRQPRQPTLFCIPDR